MGKRNGVESQHDHQQNQHQHTNHSSYHQQITPVTTGLRNVRKRKCNSNGNSNSDHDKTHKSQRLSSVSGQNPTAHNWHDSDEDSSSNDGPTLGQLASARNISSKQANNSSILLNNSFNLSLTNNEQNISLTESPKPVYTLRPSVINGTVLYDLNEKPWRLGRPIGKGNFGEIFLASDNISIPVTNENAKFVVKIEPHSNGPLFVEIHCLMNTAKKEKFYIKDEKDSDNANACCALPQEEPSGIPNYIGSGSHYFGNARYRFLVLPRFDRDLHSLIKKCRVHQKSVLTLAIQIINVLENLHDKGYCHNDVKAQNLMISKCKYLTQEKVIRKKESEGKRTINSSTKYDHYEEKQQTTDSGNSSEQEANDDDEDDDYIVVKRRMYNKIVDDNYNEESEEEANDEGSEHEPNQEDDDEDFDDGATTNSINSNSLDNYHTPKHPLRKKSTRNLVQYSGSNPVRSCRKMNGEKPNSMYTEMVKSHYLRPTKRVSYMEFFNEEGNGGKEQDNVQSNTSDDESEEFEPSYSIKQSIKKTLEARSKTVTPLEPRRLTRRQETILAKKKDEVSNCASSLEETLENKPHEQENRKIIEVEEERIFLIDYGLASKYIDDGIHRPFVMDQRRAHDGTLEYTSRDAHMGAHSRRSDMECLGYNLLFWSQGYLPWKEAATNQQQEKVHRAKEYLMTDVRELLRHIYGKQVPKYLGEYLHLVGQLAYHERPNYKRYRRIFEKEYEQLGFSLNEMQLQMRDIQRTCVRVKEEIENKNDFFDMTKNNGCVINAAYSAMHNMNVVGCGTPFHERTLSNRVSPKNLRSKSEKKGSKKKKFSWAEILSQDPDQIARERAEKEFDREEQLSDVQQTIIRRYQGKPTYAILEILNRMGRSVADYEQERVNEEETKAKNTKIEKNQTGMDVCDAQRDYEPMDVNDADESDDNQTDATEFSERRTNKTKKSKSKRQVQKSQSSSTVAFRVKPKAAVARRLELKTPEINTPPATAKPICKRTRCQKGSIVKILSPENAGNSDNTPISYIPETKLAKSSAKPVKRISKSSRKTTSSSSVAASREVKQPKSRNTRERRTRRCLIKTEQQKQASLDMCLLDDDSSSNFSPEEATSKSSNQHSSDTMYTRSYRK